MQWDGRCMLRRAAQTRLSFGAGRMRCNSGTGEQSLQNLFFPPNVAMCMALPESFKLTFASPVLLGSRTARVHVVQESYMFCIASLFAQVQQGRIWTTMVAFFVHYFSGLTRLSHTCLHPFQWHVSFAKHNLIAQGMNSKLINGDRAWCRRLQIAFPVLLGIGNAHGSAARESHTTLLFLFLINLQLIIGYVGPDMCCDTYRIPWNFAHVTVLIMHCIITFFS